MTTTLDMLDSLINPEAAQTSAKNDAKMGYTLGEKADNLFALQSEIKAKEAAIVPLKARLQELKTQVLDEMAVADQTMAAGSLGKISLKVTEIPTVPSEQWEDFYEYVHANRAFYLLHKRLSTQAVMELLKEGEDVPGVEVYTKRDLRVSGK